VRGARELGVTPVAVADFRSITGKGVTGVVEGRAVAIGNAALLADLGAKADAVAAEANRLRVNGESVMFIAVDGALADLIAVADRIKKTTVKRFARSRRKACGSSCSRATAE
jgi:P-type Cu+ transporter